MATFGGSGFVGTAINVRSDVVGSNIYTAPANTYAELNIAIKNITGGVLPVELDINVGGTDYRLYKVSSLASQDVVRLPNVILGPGQSIRNNSPVPSGQVQVSITGALFA